MNLVADESCAVPVVQALRKAGHDVIAIAEVSQGAADSQVLERGLNEKRILVTEDRDFGELVYGQGHLSPGVILVRFHSSVRHAKASSVVEAIAQLGSRLQNAFVVVQPGRVRISTRP